MRHDVMASNRPDLRLAWRGPSLIAVDGSGAAGGVPLTGFYFRETRYLSTLRLLVMGDEPVSCSGAVVGTDRLEFSFVYPQIEERDGGGSGSGGSVARHGLLARGIDLDLRLRVRPSSLEVMLDVTSRWEDVAAFTVEWLIGADFAAVLDAIDGAAGAPAGVAAEALDDGVRFGSPYPELPLETRVRASGGGQWRYEAGVLASSFPLARGETSRLTLVAQALDGADPIDTEGETAREALLREYLGRLPRIEGPGDPPLATLTHRALREIGSAALLEGHEDEWLMPAAGYPLYPAAFGRDAATASWQAAAFDRGEMAAATAARLARLQGTVRDDWRDEQPGRIIQQARFDPASRMGDLPFHRYYGDVASPFMYIMAVGNAYAWSGDRHLLERHWPAMRRVVDWAERDGDIDGDGYIEYHTRSPHGPRHQGWKDSGNAVVDELGRQVATPFAACEIQGYHMAALQFMAAFAMVLGHTREALALWKRAAALKSAFNRDFWLEDEGYVAFGLDAEKRPVRVPTSNAAQCIPTGIVDTEHLPRLVERVFAPDLFSGWGIRTLSTENPAYHPLDYHLGTVWPVENGSIIFGLRRYGFDDRAVELASALHDLAMLWPGGRVPECVGGYARTRRGHPGVFPEANSFQTWNQSVLPILLQTLLGAWPVRPLRVLAIDPVLPAWLPEITVRGWRVGDATVSLRFWRDEEGRSHHEVLEKRGRLRIVRQPPLNSIGAGPIGRLRKLIEGALPA